LPGKFLGLKKGISSPSFGGYNPLIDDMQRDEVADQSTAIINELKALVIEKDGQIESQEEKIRVISLEVKVLKEKLAATQEDLETAKRENSQVCQGKYIYIYLKRDFKLLSCKYLSRCSLPDLLFYGRRCKTRCLD
jgi:hypothetical protein